MKQYSIGGRTASEIAGSVERLVRDGRMGPGTLLPTVRELAREAGTSPGTVAAAYKLLASRGVIVTSGRRGTRVAPRPPLVQAASAVVSPHLRNLAGGNPDPALLPKLQPWLKRLDGTPHLYGEESDRRDLLDAAAAALRADGLPTGALAVLGGALDAVERVLQAHLATGDRVGIEDPGYTGVIDLVASLGLVAEPMPVDDDGPMPEAVERVLRRGARALVITPRAQNPTGAALAPTRARELRKLLAAWPDVLVIEDDHAGPIAGAPVLSLCAGRDRWAIVRSTSKWLGPDLRVSVLAGDETTIARVRGRQALGAGWVSHLLQATVASLWTDPAVRRGLALAAGTYTRRRLALIEALAREGVEAHGRSGLNVWIPVPDEGGAVARLAESGWAVRAGERYRLQSPPAIRVTTAALREAEAATLAGDIARALRPARRTATA